ncbi:MAG: DUF2141 domain-containing protein [Cyanobacteria bacterium CRU_2_1]|nr:DUF2141 domain-containing protein [Cyanobacteria bacterium RU_5_0]NJR60422.1 DUF2141 domain-containing protein [Cyanobacteria bacterium CRU_2_1]
MDQPQAPNLSFTLALPRLDTLTIELTELRNRKGVVNIAVFNSSEGFPSDASKAVKSGSFPISELPLTIEFRELPYGCYAATVHHDENMDAQLNCNALGIPKEGIGFSGNPRIWKGVPLFQRAQFEFMPDHTIVSITMKYLLR